MKKINYKSLTIGLAFIACTATLSAQVTIGGDKAPETFSVLELKTDQVKGGLRIPQLTTAQIASDITPKLSGNAEAKGLIVYNTTSEKLQFWNGTEWIPLPDTALPNVSGPWNEVGTTAPAQNNTDNVYLNAAAVIGGTSMQSGKALTVQGASYMNGALSVASTATVGSTADPRSGINLDMNPSSGNIAKGLGLPRVALTSATVYSLGVTGTATHKGTIVYNTSASTDNDLEGEGLYAWDGAKWKAQFASEGGLLPPDPGASGSVGDWEYLEAGGAPYLLAHAVCAKKGNGWKLPTVTEIAGLGLIKPVKSGYVVADLIMYPGLSGGAIQLHGLLYTFPTTTDPQVHDVTDYVGSIRSQFPYYGGGIICVRNRAK